MLLHTAKLSEKGPCPCPAPLSASKRMGTNMCCSKGEPHDLDSFSRVMNVNAVGSFNVLRLAAMR